jgi:FkbM family methyltransferase
MSEHMIYPPRWIRTINRYRRLAGIFKNWPGFLAFKWRWKKVCPQLRTRGGLAMEVPAGSTFEFKDIFLHEAYGCPHILRRLPEQPIVLDIGANVGFFSLYALHCRPAARCLSFEPLEANYRILERQRTLNPRCRWEIFQEAAAGRDGTVRICSEKEGQVDATAMIANDSNSARGEPVDAHSLPTLFATHSLDHCDWLKLDCEGSEYDIFYQCPDESLRKVRFISAELHDLDAATRNPRSLCAHLEQRGFRIVLADDAVIHALR